MKKLIFLTLLLPFFLGAQTSLVGIEDHGCSKPDSLVFYGDSVILKVYPKQDSIVILDPQGNGTMLMSASLLIRAESPSTKNLYFCYVFGGVDTGGIIIEYCYNPRSKLWGICITFEASQLKDGMALWRPFPPLRDLTPAPHIEDPVPVRQKKHYQEIKPITASGKKR